MINPQVTFYVVINGREARHPEDLNNFSKQELWNTLVNLTVSNSLLSNEMNNLRFELAEKDEIKRQLLAHINENKRFEENYDEVIVESKSTRLELDSVKKELSSIQKEFKQINKSLLAREIGNKTDELVRKYIFSDCIKKPYYIRSLKNLLKFIDDPAKAEKLGLCGERAPDEWLKLSQEKKRDVIRKSKFISENYPDLKESIENLKDYWKPDYPKCEKFDELVEFLSSNGDVDTAASLIECRPFYENTAFELIVASEKSKIESI